VNRIEAQIAAKRPELQEKVRLTLGLADAKDVQITSYVDTPLSEIGGASGAQMAEGGGIVAVGLSAYWKEIIIGILGAASLMMVSMIVRKSTPAPLPPPVMPAGKGEDEIPSISGNESLAGIALGGSNALDGHELGDDELRTQQVVDQVSSMVKENPDAAAAMVKRWLNRS
jgi:flagellar biosynthesis/type III secretory pathway M-ring protein FliF/YscJ